VVQLLTQEPTPNLYRLTGEIVANDPANNGNIGYIYDPVGNRNQRTSSITPISTQNFTGGYNPADLLKPTFSFDQNGNQTSDSQGRTYSYNTLNQLTQVTGTGVNVNYLYDGDGLRTQKVNNTTGVTTSYLWDRNNLTGYPQVTEEFQNSQLTRRYVYGPEGPLYMVQLVNGTWVTSYYGKDAQNVRFLMNDSGQITDSYTWDAFGNLISSSGVGTANNLGFDGEYSDSDTGLVFLRARWMNPTLGRFQTMDDYEGEIDDPLSLSKYQFVSNDPTDKIDPSGKQGFIGVVGGLAIVGLLSSFPDVTYAGTIVKNGKMEVGLNNKMLYLLDVAGEVVFKARVVTGAPDTPTFTGNFKLGYWEKDKTSTRWDGLSDTPWSKSYYGGNVFGAYFVPILDSKGKSVNGEGIHGKYGNNAFYEFLYEVLVPRSHGCIRLSNPDIIALHDMLPLSNGTPLEIDNFVDPTQKK
jgi:RHS repeat-associated protein